MGGFELHRRAVGSHAASTHDHHIIPKHICLFHTVRGQHHCCTTSVAADQLPGEPACVGVHAGRRFVDEDHSRVPQKGDGHAELPLLAPTQISCLAVQLGCQAHLLSGLKCHLSHIRSSVSLNGCIQLQVLTHSQVRPQHIMLRAHPEALPDALHLAPHIKAIQDCTSRGGGGEAGEDMDEGRLAGAVVPQQSCDAASREVHIHII
mmetsp:Transcript_15363/g.41567  ORF Transcript_15363/g.41567 Transcript_15363/m.41567 type:complete len:206 (-) Transcript_15363:2502-3119(-)